jgi:hypothetical protein
MAESTQIGKTIQTLHVEQPHGQKVLYTNTINSDNPDAAGFDLVSGSTVGTSIIADLTYNGTYPQAVINAAKSCPYGFQFQGTPLSRIKVRDWFISMLGQTAWATLTSLELQDGLGYPLVHVPLAAISTPNGLSRYRGSVADNPVGITATASSYNSATGAITFPSASFVSTGLVGSPFMVVAGTGAGQTGTVKTNTATVVTPNTILQTPLDATSVVTFFYLNATGESGTTVTVQSNATLGDLSNGYYVVIVAGTGIGQVRKITSSSFTTATETITVPTWTTNPDSTSQIAITQAPQLNGIIDFTGYTWAATTPGYALQWAMLGTAATAGSPLRYGLRGFWSDFG